MVISKENILHFYLLTAHYSINLFLLAFKWCSSILSFLVFLNKVVELLFDNETKDDKFVTVLLKFSKKKKVHPECFNIKKKLFEALLQRLFLKFTWPRAVRLEAYKKENTTYLQETHTKSQHTTSIYNIHKSPIVPNLQF
jgi:hypothetical protein